jgi:REP element-mobilizing transposase RayT
MLPRFKQRLPHWRLENATYFVTWRLSPQQPDLQPAERGLIRDVVNHFHRQRYELFAYVVMNDHVHALLEPSPRFTLEATIQSWKSFSANQLQRKHGRTGRVWQKDYFDRIMRDDAEFGEVMRYIFSNPQKRWPTEVSYQWVGVGGTEAAAPDVW